MLETMKPLLWQQFGAAIQMLENAIVACPIEVWTTDQKEFDFWYNAYHTIFWLDFYLSDSRDSFIPTEPYGVTEFDPSGLLPERVFTPTELLAYLELTREKCRQRIANLEPMRMFKVGSRDFNHLELLLYNLRHVQHHVGQLNQL
jgi:hypothetical protein